MYPPGTTRLCFLVVFFWWRLSTYPPDDSFREDLFPLPWFWGIQIWENEKTYNESHFKLTLNQLCFEFVFLVLWLYRSLVLSDSFNYSVHICFCICCLICFLVRVCRLMFPQMVPSSSMFPAASWDTIDEDVPGICDSILHGAHSALLLEILTGHHRRGPFRISQAVSMVARYVKMLFSNLTNQRNIENDLQTFRISVLICLSEKLFSSVLIYLCMKQTANTGPQQSAWLLHPPQRSKNCYALS